jgi:hypothetical protein
MPISQRPSLLHWRDALLPAGGISTSKQFVNGQPAVDGSDLNQMVGQASIQPAFYSAQPQANAPGSNDQLVLLQAGGAFSRLLYWN